MQNRHPPEQLKFLISTIVSPRPVFRVKVAKFRTKVAPLYVYKLKNFQLLGSKIGGYIGG